MTKTDASKTQEAQTKKTDMFFQLAQLCSQIVFLIFGGGY